MNYSQLKDNIKGTVILDAPMKKYAGSLATAPTCWCWMAVWKVW